MYSPFTKTTYILTFFPDSLKQFLRGTWSAIFWTAVLILPQVKLNLKLSCCAYFLSQQGAKGRSLTNESKEIKTRRNVGGQVSPSHFSMLEAEDQRADPYLLQGSNHRWSSNLEFFTLFQSFAPHLHPHPVWLEYVPGVAGYSCCSRPSRAQCCLVITDSILLWCA